MWVCAPMFIAVVACMFVRTCIVTYTISDAKGITITARLVLLIILSIYVHVKYLCVNICLYNTMVMYVLIYTYLFYSV